MTAPPMKGAARALALLTLCTALSGCLFGEEEDPEFGQEDAFAAVDGPAIVGEEAPAEEGEPMSGRLTQVDDCLLLDGAVPVFPPGSSQSADGVDLPDGTSLAFEAEVDLRAVRGSVAAEADPLAVIGDDAMDRLVTCADALIATDYALVIDEQ